MKYIRILLLSFLLYSTFAPIGKVQASNDNQLFDKDVEDIKINQEHLTVAKNAPKSGGVFPVEVTATENGKSVQRTLYIIVKPAPKDQETNTDDISNESGTLLTNVGNAGEGTVSKDDNDVKAREIEEDNSVDKPKYEYGVREGYKFLYDKFLNFWFLLFLLCMYLIWQGLFIKLQRTVKKELTKVGNE